MTLHIHHADRLEPLAEQLAAILAHPLVDPFTAEVVGVPTAGVRDWLQQQLALRLGAGLHRDGIAANIDMVFPNRLAAAALGEKLTTESPWALDRLTWTVLDVLYSGSVNVPGRGEARSRAAASGGLYATARRIADLFDGYTNNRPQMLQQWNAGRDGDGTEDDNGAVVPLPADQVWQAELWRAVRVAIGGPTLAEQLPELLVGVRSGALDIALPERVALFGVSAVSASQIAVLQALAHVRDVHVFVVRASEVAWTNCRPLPGQMVLRSSFDASTGVHHPLLRSWARPSLETAALINSLEATNQSLSVLREAAVDPPPSLLSRIHDGVHRDQWPPAATIEDIPPPPDAATHTHRDTVQVHACHGATRQLEVMRDALSHLFAADPTLAPNDVVLLCPDLPRFAPLIQSVFRRSALPIPVRVSDQSLGTENPVAAALSVLLATLAGRCTGAEILQLVALPPVTRMFRFDADDLERLSDWIETLGTTWGLDGEHRGLWVPDHIVEGTWTATLDRLFVGAAMPAPTPRVGPGGIVPFDHVDTDGFMAAGRLAELIARLQSARRQCVSAKPIDEWVSVLRELMDEFFDAHAADAWQLTEVSDAVGAIGQQSRGNAVPLSFADARTVVATALDDERGRLVMRSGAVTATSLVPLRNVPARVVGVLGLEELTLRGAGADGDDILGARPCVGDRDPRSENRHLLLDAVMSAREHLVITCEGRDITTNHLLPLPVPLVELLDVIRATIGRDPAVTRHPRQAFDERNFTAPAFSFDKGMLAGARARRGARPANTPWPLLPPFVPSQVTLAELAASCTRPERTLLTGRLDAVLPTDVDRADPSIPIRFLGLDQSKLGRELLEMHRAGSDEIEVRAWREAHRHSGALPPRALADKVLDDVEYEVGLLLDAQPDLRSRLTSATDAVFVEMALTAPASTSFDIASVEIAETIARIHGRQLIRVFFNRPNSTSKIAAALELAALVCQQPEVPWEALVVTRPTSAGGRNPVVDVLKPLPLSSSSTSMVRESVARVLLQTALSIHLRALREPLPLFDKSSRTLFENLTIDDDEFERETRDARSQLLWGGFAADDILAIPLRSGDEMAEIASTHVARAQALANLLWQSYEAFIPPADGS